MSDTSVQGENMRTRLSRLYFGRSKVASGFRFAMLTFDILTIAFFIISSMMHEYHAWVLPIDIAIALVIFLDFMARLWISPNRTRYMLQLTTWADLIVLVSLVAPAFFDDVLFLRVLRALRLLRSYHVLRDLRERYSFFKRNEDIIQSSLNLFVFIFVITALVYVMQVRINPKIDNYIDALYFTVTTLTTTGFGDITLEGASGRLLAIVIMVFGVALFLRLVQTIFRPQKVNYACPDCGLAKHETDAVHCKHCGRVLPIATEGA